MSNYELYDKLCDYELLEESYKRTQQGNRKYRKEAILYDMAKERNLLRLYNSLKNETYSPGQYIKFYVYEPKKRAISAPKIRDKIIQFACHTILKDIYDKVYINSTYACIEGRGAHRAVAKVQRNMRLCQWKYGDGWILKMDIRKFFYSINRDILKRILKKKIKDKKFLRLLYLIIDSSPEGEKGIPLGNVTSQDFANIYLNELDQYAKRCLGVKWYVRYMDDIIIVTKTKKEAQELWEKLEWFVNEKLDLEFNEKTKIFPLKQGVNAYGFKIYTTHRLVRNSSKAAMKRRIKAMDRKYKAGKLSVKRVKLGVNSWLGHARHSNSYNLAKKIFAKYDYIEVEHKEYKFGNGKNGTL